METNSWPNWLQELWPSWLENIGYPAPGVGDLDDLKFTLGVGDGGRWIGFVKPGWYYHNNREQYKYVQVATIVASSVSGSGVITESVSFRPNWGPVLVYGMQDDPDEDLDGPYREHHNSFYPAYSLSWTPTTSGIFTASVPSGTILVGLRDLTNLALGSVAGTGLLISNKLYYYDRYNNRIYIKPRDTSNIEVWADLLYTVPRLKMREVVVYESDGVRASYNQIENITIIRGNQTVAVTGYHATGFFSPSLTGTVAGDWVVLDYYVSKSYILLDHQTLHWYAGGPMGYSWIDTFKVYYESSIPDIIPNVIISDAVTGSLNFNPIHRDSYRTGYLFHAVPGSSLNSYWTVGRVRAYLDKQSVCSSWNELLKLSIYINEANDIPIPYCPVSVTITGASALLSMPDTDLTDGRGEIHYLLAPEVGASTIGVTAIAGAFSSIVSAMVVGSGSIIDIDKYLDGQVNLLLTDEKTKRGAIRMFVNAMNLDGIPRMSNTDTITIESELASEFNNGDNIATQSITVGSGQSITNVGALIEVGYVPQPKDKLFGSSATGQSIIVRSGDE